MKKEMVKIRYRKNSHEKYFTYEKPIDSLYLFDLVQETFKKTDAKKMEIVVERKNG